MKPGIPRKLSTGLLLMVKIGTVMAGLMGAFAIVAYLMGFRLYGSPGNGMSPTIEPGDQIIARMLVPRIVPTERYDLVVVEVPSLAPGTSKYVQIIKRIVGLPGEKVKITADGLVVNGQKAELPEAFQGQSLLPATGLPAANFLEVTLGADEYYVLGDNPVASYDSRFFGPVKLAAIRGSVWKIVHLGGS